MIGISLRQLDVFITIASTGTVRAAAERLHLTQPAASMALAELERQLATPLFTRNRGRLLLSAQGRELLPLAQEVIERVEDIQRLAKHQGGPLSGRLRVGASNTIGNYLIGELLGQFITSHPKVALQVSVENTQDILHHMLEHDLDVACVEGTVTHTQLQTLHWRNDRLVICAAPNHPLVQHKVLQPFHFKGVNWILREQGSAMRSLAEQALATLPAGQILLEFGQVEAIKQAVIAGLGISWLPEAAISDAVATGRLIRLHTPFLHLDRRFSIVLHPLRYRGALLNAFIHSLGIIETHN